METNTNTNRFLLITLETQNGEYTHRERIIKQIRKRQKALTQAEIVASQWYSGDMREEKDVYYFHCGEVAVSVDNVQEIPANEIAILKKYITEI